MESCSSLSNRRLLDVISASLTERVLSICIALICALSHAGHAFELSALFACVKSVAKKFKLDRDQSKSVHFLHLLYESSPHNNGVNSAFGPESDADGPSTH